MRRFDKTKNILKANLLAEQRYLESKGLIKEVIDNNPADNARQEYGDYEAGQQDYEERQKLKNMPNDNHEEPENDFYDKDESLDEGAKEWVVGGLLALSSIAGFYKLSDNAKRDERAKMEYVTKLNSVVDNLDSTKTIDLARQYDLTDFGTGSNSSGHIEPETSYRDDNGEMVYTNPNVESVKDNIKQEIKNHPENFQISKDGRTIKPMRQ